MSLQGSLEPRLDCEESEFSLPERPDDTGDESALSQATVEFGQEGGVCVRLAGFWRFC